MQDAIAKMPVVNAGSKEFRRDIEGLRAVAVAAVVVFHFGLRGIPGGFVGVDIFFVISGYLITGLLLRELENSGEIDLLRFYGRRSRRLLPAALLMTLVTLACGYFVFSPGEQLVFAKTAVATSLYSSNVWFLRQALDYFAPQAALNPFLHTWSLAVEEQFYLVWPAVLLLTSRRGLRPPLLIGAIAGLSLASFGLCLWLTRVNQPWAFYASPARAWEFGIGFGGAKRSPKRRSKVAVILGWIGAGALLLSFAVISESSSFRSRRVTPNCGDSVRACQRSWQRHRGPAAILSTAPFQWCGQRSYSIYLWHFPVRVVAEALYSSVPAWGSLVCGALTVVCASASYEWLEAPIRGNPWLARRAIRSISLGACLTLLGAAAGIGVWARAKHFVASPTQRAVVSATEQNSVASQQGCLIGATEAKPVSCTLGSVASSFTVVLFGDSHADYYRILRRHELPGLAKRHGDLPGR